MIYIRIFLAFCLGISLMLTVGCIFAAKREEGSSMPLAWLAFYFFAGIDVLISIIFALTYL